ncbi:unnamed protein product [Soboliphyme baturini]|uniref:Uncharacterized protein n=1 Tax=Soboliphyme baturini TaxID=241478 RepID=A0A183IGS2_9BILA|nr:unnamed protein product [Soboliphyme baturini]
MYDPNVVHYALESREFNEASFGDNNEYKSEKRINAQLVTATPAGPCETSLLDRQCKWRQKPVPDSDDKTESQFRDDDEKAN